MVVLAAVPPSTQGYDEKPWFRHIYWHYEMMWRGKTFITWRSTLDCSVIIIRKSQLKQFYEQIALNRFRSPILVIENIIFQRKMRCLTLSKCSVYSIKKTKSKLRPCLNDWKVNLFLKMHEQMCNNI